MEDAFVLQAVEEALHRRLHAVLGPVGAKLQFEDIWPSDRQNSAYWERSSKKRHI
jgi:hypothetical protein